MSFIELADKSQRHNNCRSAIVKMDYVRRMFGESGLTDLFKDILDPVSLTSSRYAFAGQPIDISFFQDTSNWYNNEINLKLFQNLAQMGVDMREMGKFSILRSKQLNNYSVSTYLRLLGPVKTLQKINEINSLYNQTKSIAIEKKTPYQWLAIIHYNPGLSHTEEVTNFNVGIYEAALQIAGANDVRVNVVEDTYSADEGLTLINIEFVPQSILKKARWFIGFTLTRWFARSYMESHHPIDFWYSDLVESLEKEFKTNQKLVQEREHYYQLLLDERNRANEELQKQVDERTQQIQRQNELLHQLIAQKDEAFAHASHELRSPLMLLINPLEEAMQYEPSHQVKRLIKRALTQGEDLVYLINKMLDFEKATALSLDEKPINRIQCDEFIGKLLDQYQHLLNKKHLSCDYSIPEAMKLQFNLEDLHSIVDNLLSNAVKYTPSHGAISVRLEKKATEVRLIVHNSGPEIDSEKLPHLFDRFYRLPGQDGIPGVGLGLSIVKKLVELHHGTISIETDPLEGNSFIVRLPLSNAMSDESESDLDIIQSQIKMSEPLLAKPEIPALLSSMSSRESKRILVVEDNPALLSYITEVLQVDYCVTSAIDGRSALASCESQSYDLIITDLMMPELDGLSLLKKLRDMERFKEIPVLILSARSDQNLIQQCYELMGDYLIKPVAASLLKAKVASLLLSNQLSGSADTLSMDEKMNQKDREWLQRLESYMSTSFSDNSLSPKELAAHMAVSERTLQRRLKELMQLTPREYIASFRLNKALEMLKKGNDNLGQVAALSGFTDHPTFTKAFKKQFGAAPSQFQR